MSHIERVRDFVAAWERLDVEAILARMTPDARYVNVGFSEAVGHDAIRAVVLSYAGMASNVRWIIDHIAEAADGTVLTERTDMFELNGQTVSVTLMGVFEFSGDLISGWRDYFDLPGFQAQMAAATSRAATA